MAKLKLNAPEDSLQPFIEDGSEFPVGAIIDFPKLDTLPVEFSIQNLSVKNQIADGNDDFCASAAGTVAKEVQENVELFYPYVFAAAKHESGKDPDAFGLSIKDVGKALCEWGVPELKDVSESVLNLEPAARRRFENYPEALREKAKIHKGQTYFFVYGPHDPYDNARCVQEAFRLKGLKMPLVFGVKFGWDLEQFVLAGTPEGFGHAMTDFGWYENGIKVLNSAGVEAGKDGFHSIPRETFNYFAGKYGILVITDMPRNEAEKAVRVLNSNWLIKLFYRFMR